MRHSKRRAVKDLPALVRAREISALMQENHWRQVDVGRLLGITQSKVSRFLSPLKLIPELQAMMEPTVHESKQLHFATALILVRKSRAAQLAAVKDLLPTSMPEKQLAQVRKNLKRYYDSQPRLTRSSQPSLTTPEPPAQNSTPVQPEKKSVTWVKPASAKPTNAPMRALPPSVYQAPKPVVQVVVNPLPPQPVPQPPPTMEVIVVTPTPAPPQPPPAPIQPPPWRPDIVALVQRSEPTVEAPSAKPVPQYFQDGLHTVEYWDERILRITLGKVDKQKYLALFRAGHLKFQREGKDRPSFYPDPEHL